MKSVSEPRGLPRAEQAPRLNRMKSMTVRTRFAPSPTGYLHIGGVRTALFNWLYAKKHGGQFILRIDDTDAERNRPEALQPILDGFQWLGIHWDEGPGVGGPFGPYFQAQRADLYRAAAMKTTPIISAKQHLSNTPTQVLVYEAMGVKPPVFAHVPVVNAPGSNKKLSKRDAHKFVTPDVIAILRAVHAVPAEWTDEQIKKNESLNPVMVEYYRVLGYLPEALINYFGRLGWSLDDKTEIISLETMLANFGFGRVNASPASFDPQKLHWLAGEYMRMAPIERKVEGVIPILQRAGL